MRIFTFMRPLYSRTTRALLVVFLPQPTCPVSFRNEISSDQR
ncbi:hypothetical protein D1AOALGA4SA_9643 [Olavius algarvensis Delta 1 endosymbiont]|nr:hypothetical protein D1AOALGA4SA_9643 [Olavius algarvensis Delta 1 endosymbiont]